MSAEVHDFASWRHTARRLLTAGTPPDDVAWTSPADDQVPLPLAAPAPAGQPEASSGGSPRVPRAFVTLAEEAADHRRPEKWDLLYRLLWRVVRDGAHLLALDTDPQVHEVRQMAAQVRRDEHKMRAFVRFTPTTDPDGPRYVAWYEPDHPIVRRAAPFFADRFSGMRWSILTPDLSVHWDRAALSFTAGVPRPMAAEAGEIESLWRTYYAAAFNPARANLRATLREMPLRRWRDLPEAALIPSLLSTAHERAREIDARRAAPSARPFVPDTRELERLRQAAPGCRGCRLVEAATQVVFGDGPARARLVLVGEQPGDAEDLSGRPFVGPAGEVLDRALAAAGVERHAVYLTNAVKHFSFEPRGKRRIHQTPRLSEMQACRPWLEAELQAIRPAVVVCLGSTAARALVGPQARVMALRGRAIEGLSWAPRVYVTVHPSAVLRSQDDGEKYYAMLVGDLALAAGDVRDARRDAPAAPA